MKSSEKYELLEYTTSLGDIFNTYKEYNKLEIEDENLKENFLNLLIELIQDGSIELYDYRVNPPKRLSGKPEEQVNALRKVWPTMQEMIEYFPEDPFYYVEWFWWGATCPIELNKMPNIEIYKNK
nr:DUF596 domain-containing protein [Neisseria sp. HSC-16F19]